MGVQNKAPPSQLPQLPRSFSVRSTLRNCNSVVLTKLSIHFVRTPYLFYASVKNDSTPFSLSMPFHLSAPGEEGCLAFCRQ